MRNNLLMMNETYRETINLRSKAGYSKERQANEKGI